MFDRMSSRRYRKAQASRSRVRPRTLRLEHLEDRLAPAISGISLLGPSYESVTGAGHSATNREAISPDGRYIAFTSGAANLVEGDTHGTTDVFLRDTLLGTTTRVNTSSTGEQANGQSYNCAVAVTPDGHVLVAFDSYARNLVPGDTNNDHDVFLKDLTTGDISRVSTDSLGNQSNAGGYRPALAVDSLGNAYIAFESGSSNLVPGDTNGAYDVFVKDLTTGNTLRVSTDSAGAQGNGYSNFADIAVDAAGHVFVAFYTDASTLVPGDTNGTYDVFVKDLSTGALTRASTSAVGIQGNAGSSRPSIAVDASGHVLVAFESGADNLVPDDTNNRSDVFVKDLNTGALTRVSTSSSGAESNFHSSSPALATNASGKSVVTFNTLADNLVLGDINNSEDVFVKDLTTDIITLASTNSSGGQGDSYSYLSSVAVDSSGQVFVAFTSRAANLVGGDANQQEDVFVKGLATGTTTLVSGRHANLPSRLAGAASDGTAISPDGRYVAFASFSNQLVEGDTNNTTDVFVRDTLLGTTTRVSTDAGGNQVNGYSYDPAITVDASGTVYVAFVSSANNLVPDDTNNQGDVFVKNLATGAITRASTDSAGGQVNVESSRPAIAIDASGHVVVAFDSSANNLVAGENNNDYDVFVKDLTTGVTTLVSTDSTGVQGNRANFAPAITRAANGHILVAFESAATNLVSGDTNSTTDIFVKDLATGITTRASTDSAGGEANSHSQSAALATDASGHVYVAFVSYASNLVPGDTSIADVFVKELTSGTITRVSYDVPPEFVIGGVAQPSIAVDLRGHVQVAYLDNYGLEPAYFSPIPGDVFLKDLTTGTSLHLTSQGIAGHANYDSDSPAVAVGADGRVRVGFNSTAGNLTSGDYNGSPDTFLYVGELPTPTTTTAVSVVHPDRVSVSGALGSNSDRQALSHDGRYVAFISAAPNLVPGDTNGVEDVFVFDRQTGITVRASTDASGVQGNGTSGSPALLYANGDLLVAFQSESSNLVADDANGRIDIFVKNLTTNAVTRVSTDVLGNEANGDSFRPALILDGDFHVRVAFASTATNLVSGDSNNSSDIFVKDLTTSGIFRANVDALGNEALGFSNAPALARGSEGQLYLAFESDAPNLVAGDNNGTTDVFVKELAPGATTGVGAVTSVSANGNNLSYEPALTRDGGHVLVAFTSYASNLVAGDANGTADVFLRDLTAGTTTLVSTGPNGQANDTSSAPTLLHTENGILVGFQSYANNLAPDGNGNSDVFVRNMSTGAITLASADPAGIQGNSGSFSPALTFDAVGAGNLIIAFSSFADNLVAGDANASSDVFVKDLEGHGIGLVSGRDAGLPSLLARGAVEGAHAISPDGRYIAYTSQTQNHVNSPVNGTTQVYLRDTLLHTTTLVSADATGAPGVGFSNAPALIYREGVLYVAFTSAANNLVAADTNGATDVFLRNMSTGQILRVSTDASGNQADGGSFGPALALNAAGDLLVSFTSAADNLVSPHDNTVQDVFVKNVTTNEVTLVTEPYPFGELSGHSWGSSIAVAPNGDVWVAFETVATHLVTPDTNGALDIVVKNLATGEFFRASSTQFGVQANGPSYSPTLAITPGGQVLVAFLSDASNLGSPSSGVFIKNLQTGSLTLVASEALSSAPSLAIGPDGHALVAFASFASNLVAGDHNSVPDVFVKDLWTGAVTRVSVRANGGEVDGASFHPSLAVDDSGSVHVAFMSLASNVTPGDYDDGPDVFLFGPNTAGPSTPTDTDAADNLVFEGVADGTPVGITAHSTAPTGTVSYRLLEDAGGRFTIDPDTGVVTVANGALISYAGSGASHSYQIVVEASNGQGTASEAFTIAVAPPLIHLEYHVSSNPTVTDYTLRRNEGGVELVDTNNPSTVLFQQTLDELADITIFGLDDLDDHLTIDFAYGGYFTLPHGMTFLGGSGNGFDRLDTVGGDFDYVSAVLNGGAHGSWVLQPVGPERLLQINYNDLDRERIGVTSVDNLFFSLSLSPLGVLADDGVAGNATSLLGLPGGFLEFVHPSTGLYVYGNGAARVVVNLTDGLGSAGVTIVDADSIELAHLETAGAVVLSSTHGVTEQLVDAEVDLVASSLTVVGGRLGTVDEALETQVGKLEVLADEGGVFVSNTGALSLGGASGDLTGISSVGGVDIQTTGTLTLDEAVFDSGGADTSLRLTSLGTGSDLVIGADVTEVSGQSLWLQAGSDILHNAGVVTANVHVQYFAGSSLPDGEIVMAPGTRIGLTGAEGLVALAGEGGIVASRIDAGSTGEVLMTSRGDVTVNDVLFGDFLWITADVEGDGTGTASIGPVALEFARGVIVEGADIDLSGAITSPEVTLISSAVDSTPTIFLGTAPPGEFGLSDAELDRIFADTLTITKHGGPPGPIVVNAALSPAHVLTLILQARGDVVDANATGVDITVPELRVLSYRGVSLDLAVDRLEVDGGTPVGGIPIDLEDADGLSILRLDAGPFGPATLRGGTYTLSAAGAITSVSSVVVEAGATLDLAGFDTEVGTLAGDGNVALGAGTLTVGLFSLGSTVNALNGAISGTGGLTWTGQGTFILGGANSYTGATTVRSGTLRVDGSLAGGVTVESTATLSGGGTVGGSVTVNPGGSLSPGSSAGILRTGSLSGSSGATFRAELNGTAPGSGYDQLAVTGAVDLGGATLNLTTGFSPPTGAQFLLIDNDGTDAVTGTYSGLPEGATLNLSGKTYSITYHGGSGNDVALVPGDTIAPTIASVTSLTPNGTYRTGSMIDIRVVFSEPITLAGGPLRVILDTGAIVSIAPGAGTTLAGTYTVGSGQYSADLDSVFIALGSGASLADDAGNPLGSTAIPAGQSLKDLKDISTMPGGAVVASQVDDGTGQRSMVRSLQVTFRTALTSSDLPEVLSLLSLKRISDNLNVGLTGTLDGTGKVLTLKFTGGTYIGKSLADGRYVLRYGPTTPLDSATLFRLFGDINGDGQVDAADETKFLEAMNTRKGLSPKYNAYFDYTADGLITNSDQSEFNKRKGKKLDANGFLVPI